MENKKSFKETMLQVIKPLYAWLTVGILSTAVLVTLIVLILQA